MTREPKMCADAARPWLFWLCRAMALLLAVTAAGKFWDLAQGSVSGLDPVLGWDRRWVWWAVASVEAGVAWYLWRGRQWFLKGLLLLWLGGHFVAYHVALGPQLAAGCGCLGWHGHAQQIRPAWEGLVAQGMAISMGLVGMGCTWMGLRQAKHSPTG